MQISNRNGLCIAEGSTKLFIDAEKKCESSVVITHAHSDHSHLNNGCSYIMSSPTKNLIYENKINDKKIREIEFNEKIKFDDFEVSFHNSGHILGAMQVFVEGSKDVAITSDFKLQKSLILEPAEILRADVLVIESTFGMRHFSFPSREKVYEEMIKWLTTQHQKKKFIVLCGYAIGKAQELTAIVNEFLGETPLVHEKIYRNNKIYEKFGIKLGNYIKLDHNLKDSDILILPPSLVSNDVLQAIEFSLHRKVVSAIATGWQFAPGFDKVFPLSDHADFTQLIEYITQAKPKMVYTYHGFAKEFASHIERKLKIPARALSESGQRSIAEFLD